MKKWLRLFFVLMVLGGSTSIPALADAAPPPPPDGRNILPGEEITMVQMVAEEVIIDVGATWQIIELGEEYYHETLSGYVLAFNCTFWMVNQGSESESMAVRFPIHYKYSVGRIEIHSIKINGDSVYWWEDEIDRTADFNWAHFNVTFPPGEEVEIKITYTTLTYPNGLYHGIPHEIVSYVLSTGAGWYGPIGKGKIILRLPYNATPENVFTYRQEKKFIFTESDVYWEFTDLEPTTNDNLWIDVVSPANWLDILSERAKLEESPNNTAALHRLAASIYDISIYMHYLNGPETLFTEGFNAIEKAARLLPNDLDVHILYLDYLITNADESNVELIEEELSYIQSLDNELSQDGEFTIMEAERIISDLSEPKPGSPTATEPPGPTQEPSPVPPTLTLTPTPYITDEPVPPYPTETPEPPPTAVPPARYPPFGNVPYRIILLWTAMGVGPVLLIVFVVILIRRRK